VTFIKLAEGRKQTLLLWARQRPRKFNKGGRIAMQFKLTLQTNASMNYTTCSFIIHVIIERYINTISTLRLHYLYLFHCSYFVQRLLH